MLRVVVWICSVAILLLLVSIEGGRCVVSCEKLFSVVCCLSGLYFVLLFRDECVVSFSTSFEALLVRKQIHAMNWRFLSNKAMALLLLQDSFRRRRPNPKRGGKPSVRRCESAGVCVQPVEMEGHRKRRRSV